MTQRGAVEIGGAVGSGSAILAMENPVPVGGRDPAGLRREIAVAADGAIAIFTSGDLVAVDVRDHLATAAANSAALPSEVMVIAGQSGGTVRALATDATGGLAITDSGNDLTVSGSTDAPFTQGGGVITADTMRATLATDDLIVPDIDAVRVAVEIMDDWDELNRAAVNSIAGQVGVQGAAGIATALTQRTTIATDDVVTIDGSAGAAVQQGAGAVSAATLRITQATDDAAAVALADDSIALEAGTATVGSVQVLGLAPDGTRPAIRTSTTGSVAVQDDGGSLTIDNAALSVVGGGVEATALRVTVATDSTGVLSVDDNAGSLTIDNAALSVTGGGVEATALRVTLANDSTGLVSVDDNAGSLTVDAPTATPVAVRIGDAVDTANVTAANELNVIASAQPGVDLGDVTLTAGTATVGSVTITVRDPAGALIVPLATTERSLFTVWQDTYLDETGVQRTVTLTSSNISVNPAPNAGALVAAVGGSRIRIVAFKISADAGAGSVRWFSGGIGVTAISSSTFLAAEGGWTNGENGAWRRSYQTAVGEGLFLGGSGTAPLGVDVWTVTVP